VVAQNRAMTKAELWGYPALFIAAFLLTVYVLTEL
jgi:hypothetical protein